MPGWAGSSWYFNRYMDAQNQNEWVAPKALDYWNEVDFYMGGSEHATGHLLYSRFWQKVLFDLGYVNTGEYAKKLVNQGMILEFCLCISKKRDPNLSLQKRIANTSGAHPCGRKFGQHPG